MGWSAAEKTDTHAFLPHMITKTIFQSNITFCLRTWFPLPEVGSYINRGGSSPTGEREDLVILAVTDATHSCKNTIAWNAT